MISRANPQEVITTQRFSKYCFLPLKSEMNFCNSELNVYAEHNQSKKLQLTELFKVNV